MLNPQKYAHVLLFACPRCQRPLCATCTSTKKNLEVAEVEWFSPHCHCGWHHQIAGVTAIKHWVESWDGDAPVGAGVPGSCDTETVHGTR